MILSPKIRLRLRLKLSLRLRLRLRLTVKILPILRRMPNPDVSEWRNMLRRCESKGLFLYMPK